MYVTNFSYLTFFCIILMISLIIVYFSKERVKTSESFIYIRMCVLNVLCLILQFLSSQVSYYYDSLPYFISTIIIKAYIFFLVFFAILVLLYLIDLLKKDSAKIIKIISIIYTVLCLAIFFLPLELKLDFENQSVYSKGLANDYGMFLSFIVSSIVIVMMVLNIKKMKNRKIVPLIVYLCTCIIALIIQKINPDIKIIAYVETFLCFLMYHTIENPDLKMMRELELAKDHADKANRAKSDFLSSMSHEIRTPLNAIVGFSEMIETEDSIEACKEDAKDIVLASHTLLEIVNGILDISKIEANKMEIVNKEYSLLPELENLAKLMVPRIGDKDLKLISNFAPDIPSVLYGDIGKIKEVITNLLTNAVKYTDSGTINFNVSCINEKEYSSFVISVEDTGRGIKADHIDKLFTKFQRLDEDKNTTIEGTGLGLAITKNLVEMMGGKIVVQSEYGKGSIFTVYLKQKIVKLHDGVSGDAVSSEEKLDFSGKKVLVVDDNGLNIKLAKRLLANYNIDIDTAESGFECIDKVKENKYDLILLDDMMPKMRGTETLVKLKEDSSFNTPVVALTANSLSGIREVYLNAGFIDYLAKPIEKNELNKVFTKYLINNKDYSDKKILIVDDNKINIKIASKILSTFKFQIDEALSGQECIDKVKENKYDIIFMDYMMPGMDGIETFNKLKENEGFNTPVVALTADVVDNAKEKFIKEGFSDYISKPIDKEYLKEVVEKIIK